MSETNDKKDGLVIDMLDTSTTTPAAAPAAHNTPVVQDKRTSSRAVAAAPVEGPMAGALAFLKAGGSAAQLKEMLDLQREWEAGEAKKAYVQAMAEFKLNAQIITKDKTVKFKTDKGVTEYKHATLGNVVDTITTGLAEVGISHSWDTQRKGDRVHVTCTLTHKMGHSESVELDSGLETSGTKNNIQAMGSAITYLQRYTLLAITGSATAEQDDDGLTGGTDTEAFEKAAAGIDQTLVQNARDAALLGWRGLAAWIAKCTEAERKALEPISAALKDAAKAADEVSKSTTKGMQ